MANRKPLLPVSAGNKTCAFTLCPISIRRDTNIANNGKIAYRIKKMRELGSTGLRGV